MRLRPFILENEDTYFPKVANVVLRNLSSANDVAIVRNLKKLFGSRAEQSLLRVRLEGRDLGEHEVFSLVVNSEFYHFDQKKKQVVSQLSESEWFSPDDMFQLSLCDKARAVLVLARCIEEEFPATTNSWPSKSPAV